MDVLPVRGRERTEVTRFLAKLDPTQLDPGHLWVLGLLVDNDGAIAGPGRREYSYWADCDCPDLCLRDHENRS